MCPALLSKTHPVHPVSNERHVAQGKESSFSSIFFFNGQESEGRDECFFSPLLSTRLCSHFFFFFSFHFSFSQGTLLLFSTREERPPRAEQITLRSAQRQGPPPLQLSFNAWGLIDEFSCRSTPRRFSSYFLLRLLRPLSHW